MNEQLIFKLSRRQAYNREDFFVSKTNSLAVKILENWKNFSSSGLVIVGPSACGKTHLAAVWSKETSAKSYDISTFFGIDRNHLIDEKFIVLEDVEKLELIPKDKRLIIEEIFYIFLIAYLQITEKSYLHHVNFLDFGKSDLKIYFLES